MDGALEHLDYIGAFGLDVEIEFAILELDYGDGYDDSSLVGSTQGTRSWRLVFKVLPATFDGAIPVAPEIDSRMLQSRADYLWDFFCRHKARGNASFSLTCPKDEKKYLGKFVEHKLTYTLFMTKLFSSGVLIRQRREAGVSVDVDGSLGPDTSNPDVI